MLMYMFMLMLMFLLSAYAYTYAYAYLDIYLCRIRRSYKDDSSWLSLYHLRNQLEV